MPAGSIGSCSSARPHSNATMAGEENSNPQSEGGGAAAMEIDEPSSKVAARKDETQLPWVEKYRPKR